MKLTGKAKEAFEKWYTETECKNLNLLGEIRTEFRMFYNVLTDSMQFGVYQDFFKSPQVMMLVDVSFYNSEVTIVDYDGEEEDVTKFEIIDLELHEYNAFAIEKADQIFNERL